MASVALTIPNETMSWIERFSWVNWSDVGREAFLKKAKLQEDLEEFERIS